MNRFHARAGSALVLAAAAFCAAAPVRAQTSPSLWFAGTRLILAHPAPMDDDIAVATRDSGLVRFLAKVGATLSYAPGENYIVVTTADRRTITLTLGDARFTNGRATQPLPFAPFAQGGDAYIPLYALARALYVAPVRVGEEIVLEPELGSLDVANTGRRTTVTLHGATPLRFKKIDDSPGRLRLAFTGVTSPLAPARPIRAAGLGEIDVDTSGSAKSPVTTLTFSGPGDAVRVLGTTSDPNAIVLEFAPRGTVLAGAPIPESGVSTASAQVSGVPYAPPPYQPAPVTPAPYAPPAASAPAYPGSYASPVTPAPYASAEPAASAATVTSVGVEPFEDGVAVRVSLSGTAAYDWHRLAGADHRWYLDLHGASLAFAPREERPSSAAVSSVRIAQLHGVAEPTVRIAMTLAGTKRVDITPNDGGFTLAVAGDDAIDLARSGSGQIGNGQVAVAPLPQNTAAPADNGWKFGSPAGNAPPIAPPLPGSNPRLIVIDPGHGGSDPGAQHNGLTEKNLTLDISQRLRSLLVARGWIVKMTRSTDVDVYGPNASDRAELQARCDVANAAGARLFISVHINSATNADVQGTTTYYYKPQDRAFAASIQRHLIPLMETQDDGVQRANFYVVRHTTMPAVLVETAFLSNPHDASLLKQAALLQNVAVGIARGIGEYAGSPASVPVSSVPGGE